MLSPSSMSVISGRYLATLSLTLIVLLCDGAIAAAVRSELPLPRLIASPTVVDDSISSSGSTKDISFEDAVSLAFKLRDQQIMPTQHPMFDFESSALRQDDDAASHWLGAMQPVQNYASPRHVASKNFTGMLESLSPPANSPSTTSDDEILDKRQSTKKVMIVGDSMSQGLEGDFTWRFRIYQWFKANNIPVDFVGPYSGTAIYTRTNPGPDQPPVLYGSPQATPGPSVNGKYATAAGTFDSDHFAVWGRAAAVDRGLINGMVSTYGCDLMLLMLGFNDMGWFYSDAPGTLNSVKALIDNARAANPSMQFAVANVVQRTFIGGRQDLVDNTNIYNGLLRNAIPNWSTTQSPIYLVELRENYACETDGCPAGYDGLHPNELGEYQIARAFSLSLNANFGLGSGPLTIPGNVPGRPLPAPSNFQVVSSPQGVTATWDPVYGAYGYEIQSSINGGGIINYSPGTSNANRWDSHWAIDGWSYAVSVRAVAGDTRKSDWTSTLSAVAHPLTAPGPKNVKVRATNSALSVSWDPPTGSYTDSIVEYNVIYWDVSSCDFLNGAAFKSSPAQINLGFPTGHHIFIAVETWNAAGAGFPTVANQAVAGYGTPGAPSGLVVDSVDPTTVHLTWNADAAAGGYALWLRNVNNVSDTSRRQDGLMDTNCKNIWFLFPGTWNYEFCISSLNGDLESPKGPCSVAPSPTASRVAPDCPAPPAPPTGCGFNVSPGGTGTLLPTTTQNQGSATTSTNTGTPVNWPVVTNGQCRGPDCDHGQCIGLLCASFGCTGADCVNGGCIGPNCVEVGCLGPRCTNGVCNGFGCITKGCVGAQCNSDGSCSGPNCISLGCIGSGCGSNGICTSPVCGESWCLGIGCLNGVCSSKCTDGGTINGGGGGGTANPTTTPTSCATTRTVSNCNVNCNIILGEGSPLTTCGSSSCSSTRTGCSLSGTTIQTQTTWTCQSPIDPGPSTYIPDPNQGGGAGTSPTVTSPAKTSTPASPTYISCSSRNADPGQGINQGYCVCSSSTFPFSTDSATPVNNCAYTTKPSMTVQASTAVTTSTNTAACQVCTIYGQAQSSCSSKSACTTATSAKPSGCTPSTPASTATTFYLFDLYAQHCTMNQNTQVCAPPNYKQNVITPANYNCNYLNGLSYTGDVKYTPDQSPQPSSFTITSAVGLCTSANLVFTRQCDGNYYVTGASGTSAYCTPRGGNSLNCNNGMDAYMYGVDLKCTGNICFK